MNSLTRPELNRLINLMKGIENPTPKDIIVLAKLYEIRKGLLKKKKASPAKVADRRKVNR